MATVTRLQSFGEQISPLLGLLDTIQNARTKNAYQKSVQELLGTQKETVTEEQPYTMQRPTGWQPVGNEMQPTGFEPQQTTVPIERPMTQEEQVNEDLRIKKGLEALGAGVPTGLRVDTSPWSPTGGSLGFEERMALKTATPEKPSLWEIKDEKGNRVGNIKRSINPPALSKQGYTVEKYTSPTEQARIEQAGVSTSVNLQKLVSNYKDNPNKENTIPLNAAFKQMGYKIITPEQPTLIQKAKNYFAGTSNPPTLYAIDKKGNYVGFDAEGNRINKESNKPDKFGFTIGEQRKLKNGKIVTYKGNDEWQ